MDIENLVKKRVIIGSTNDGMIVVTNQTLTFADGIATFNAKSTGTAYGKTISNVLAQIKVAGAAYTGDLVYTIVLFLS